MTVSPPTMHGHLTEMEDFMKRFALSIIILAAVSLSLPGCFDTIKPTQAVYIQDTTRNDMGVKNPVTVHISYSLTNNLSIYSNGQIISGTNYAYAPDSIIVPDSAQLYAYFGTGHSDTTASPNMRWRIGN